MVSSPQDATPFERLLLANMARALGVEVSELSDSPEVLDAFRGELYAEDLTPNEEEMLASQDENGRPTITFDDLVQTRVKGAMEATLALTEHDGEDAFESLPKVVFVGSPDQVDTPLAAPTLVHSLAQQESSSSEGGNIPTVVIASSSAYEELDGTPTLTIGEAEYSLSFPQATQTLTDIDDEDAHVVKSSEDFDLAIANMRKRAKGRVIESDRIGSRVEDYVLVKPLGKGGFGEVYLGQHVDESTVLVAIKFIPAHKEPHHLRQEVLKLVQLKHPNIVEWREWGFLDDGTAFLIMEFIDGSLLSDVLKREKRLEPDRVTHILNEIHQALRSAHHLDILHLDLKPENIFLSQGLTEDDPEKVKLIDFGIGITLGDRDEKLRGLSPKYASPEHFTSIQGNDITLDPRSDIYSVGIIGYELVTGKLPFKQPNFDETDPDARSKYLSDWSQRHLEQKPQKVKSMGVKIPRRIAHFIDRSLEKNIENRWTDTAEACGYLQRTLNPPAWIRYAKITVPIAVLLLSVIGFFINKQLNPPIVSVEDSVLVFDSQKKVRSHELGQARQAGISEGKTLEFRSKDGSAVTGFSGVSTDDGFSISVDENADWDLEKIRYESNVHVTAGRQTWDNVDLVYLPTNSIVLESVSLLKNARDSDGYEVLLENPKSIAIAPERTALRLSLSTPYTESQFDGFDKIRRNLLERTIPHLEIRVITSEEHPPIEQRLSRDKGANTYTIDLAKEINQSLGRRLTELGTVQIEVSIQVESPTGTLHELASLPPLTTQADPAQVDFGSTLFFYPIKDSTAVTGTSDFPGEVTFKSEGESSATLRFSTQPIEGTSRHRFDIPVSALGLDGIDEERELDKEMRFTFVQQDYVGIDTETPLTIRLAKYKSANYSYTLYDLSQSKHMGEITPHSGPGSSTPPTHIRNPSIRVDLTRDGREQNQARTVAWCVVPLNTEPPPREQWESGTLERGQDTFSAPIKAGSFDGNGDYEFLVADWELQDDDVTVSSAEPKRFPIRYDTQKPRVNLTSQAPKDPIRRNQDLDKFEFGFTIDDGTAFSGEVWLETRFNGEILKNETVGLQTDTFVQNIGPYLRAAGKAEGKADGDYEFRVTATDSAGNQTIANSFAFTVAIDGPRLSNWTTPRKVVEGPLEIDEGQLQIALMVDDPNGVKKVNATITAFPDDRKVTPDPYTVDLNDIGDSNWKGAADLNYLWSARRITVCVTSVDQADMESQTELRTYNLGPIDPKISSRVSVRRNGLDESEQPSIMRRVVGDREGDYVFSEKSGKLDSFLRKYPYPASPLYLEIKIDKEQLDGFYLDEKEVSIAQFLAFVNSDNYREQEWWFGSAPTTQEQADTKARIRKFIEEKEIIDTARYPIVNVSWKEASAYAKWTGKRLAKHLEYELAVRGLDRNRISTRPHEIPKRIQPFPTVTDPDFDSEVGFHHLCGGVAEWTCTPDSVTLTKGILLGSAPENSENDSFIVFGGHYREQRIDYNYYEASKWARAHIGFRCAISIQDLTSLRDSTESGPWKIRELAP